MNRPPITEVLKERLLYFDGAMGTMVQKHGLEAGEAPEVFSLSHPDVIADIHKRYLDAGANIITANTFGANAHKLASTGLTPDEVVAASVTLARKAAGERAYVALDIGPIGELLEPMGTLSFEDAYEQFKEQAIVGERSGADLALIETMSDLYEIKAAVLAVKENTKLPVFATLTVEENGRTFTGCDMEAFAVLAESLGVCAIGLNCSLGPVQMLPHVKRLTGLTSLPVIFQPNAGLPHVINGTVSYDITPEQFGTCQHEAATAGVSIIGGCCGTTPDYIAEAVRQTDGLPMPKRSKDFSPRLCVPTAAVPFSEKTVIANLEDPNKNGTLKECYHCNDASELINLALDAADEGAEVFCINTAVPGIDEISMMETAVKEVQTLCRLPLLLSASSPEALEAGLRCVNGRAAVSIPNREDFCAVAKKYGAVIQYR